MPHIIVMHTQTEALDVPVLLNGLHESLAAQDTVNKAQIKTYNLPIMHCVVSDETRPDHMIHIQVRMKPGRPVDLKTKIARDLHALARTHVDDHGYACAVSVEIHELDEPTYQSSYSE